MSGEQRGAAHGAHVLELVIGALVAVLVLCNASSARADHPLRPGMAPCPRNEILDAALKLALASGKQQVSKIHLEGCEPTIVGKGRGKGPGWIVAFLAEDARVTKMDDNSKYTRHLVVLDEGGHILYEAVVEQYSELDVGRSQEPMMVSLHSVDLDGDGIEEIVAEVAEGRWAVRSSVEVYRHDDVKLVRVLSAPLSFSDAGKSSKPTVCEGRWSIVELDGRLLMTVVNVSWPPEPNATNCPPPGTTVYSFRGGRVAKAIVDAPKR